MKRRMTALAVAALLAGCCPHATETLKGTIADASMNTLTVRDGAGKTYTFSTLDADKSRAYGLLSGAPVTVAYEGRYREGAAATAVATDPTYAEAVGIWMRQGDAGRGIELEVGGAAQSIRMATPSYTSWRLQGAPGRIELEGTSEGSGAPIRFTQAATIARNAEGRLTLSIEGTQGVWIKAEE